MQSERTAQANTGGLSPELVPIVTLLSAQTHRRYIEGVFLILNDLNSDGSPGERLWKEVYGVLIGTQLALWDAKLFAANNYDAEKLMRTTTNPTYINFTDSNFRSLGPQDAAVDSAKKKLTNAISVSTTLKNRYFLQFNDLESFLRWNAAFRLSAFEFSALQESYTGALLSTRGSLLSDIRVILADTKFAYEEWVSVRFGSGMRWKRCYAVISQPSKKLKNGSRCGQISFYDTDKKLKKSTAMAVVTAAHAAYALYPSSPVLIDSSTMIKLEGSIIFSNKEVSKQADIFIMPEKHSAVPGYDTLIRFLIPLMNSFQLYGRPKTLIASKDDPNSLLFSLPTLPHVHYLQVDDLLSLSRASNSTWTVRDWRNQIKGILKGRLNKGYTGCGSTTGLNGALASPALGHSEYPASNSPTSPHFAPSSATSFLDTDRPNTITDTGPQINFNQPIAMPSRPSPVPVPVFMESRPSNSMKQFNGSYNADPNSEVKNSAAPQMQSSAEYSRVPKESHLKPNAQTAAPYPANEKVSVFKERPVNPLVNVPRNLQRDPTKTEHDNSYDTFAKFTTDTSSVLQIAEPDMDYNHRELYRSRADLSQIYDKYSEPPFGGQFTSSSHSLAPPRSNHHFASNSQKRDSVGAYDEYKGTDSHTKKLDISRLRNSVSSQSTAAVYEERNGRSSTGSSFENVTETAIENDDVLDDFYNLSKEISSMTVDTIEKPNNIQKPISVRSDSTNTSVNVFDPDYDAQSYLMNVESNFSGTDSNIISRSEESLPGSQYSVGRGVYKTKDNLSSVYSDTKSTAYLDHSTSRLPAKQSQSIPVSNNRSNEPLGIVKSGPQSNLHSRLTPRSSQESISGTPPSRSSPRSYSYQNMPQTKHMTNHNANQKSRIPMQQGMPNPYGRSTVQQQDAPPMSKSPAGRPMPPQQQNSQNQLPRLYPAANQPFELGGPLKGIQPIMQPQHRTLGSRAPVMGIPNPYGRPPPVQQLPGGYQPQKMPPLPQSHHQQLQPSAPNAMAPAYHGRQ
ncbi:Skg3p Ecym_1071 [Eremothecium cymbalariae DBVPG|uniref:Skg3/CAF120-like PH-like domain-containing protein n=1 Tax=Eremothecium cymbalariae (strain CBS 270.75 / DBVPG 7215 / KCTC 17166 / NRRL Y-17582) TaxID=931890 RepID=G8JMC0_ERECY|nr:hypothetical protein Ecym_1071 [Eremothecium cymbalariae DBVPG\